MATRKQQQPLRRGSLAAACLLLASLSGVSAFIKIQGGTFVDENCKEFFFSGYNTWELLETAAGYQGNSGDLNAQFAAAAANNLTVVRMFGFGVASGFQLQYSPGSYNERAFQAFDKVVDTASKYNLRLVIALVNNWAQDSMADNKAFYTGSDASSDQFFNSSSAKQAYKNHLKTVVNRRNTINGKVYGSDPTILSWNLINEPRCASLGCNADMQAWIAEMAPYLKGLDPNHLVTVGMDGFYDRRSCHAASGNPSSWAGYTGQDFLPNHAVAGIDYAAIHLWPDNWKRVDLDFGKIWLNNHSSDGSALAKPVVVEEFGKGVGASTSNDQGSTEADRLGWYKLVYAIVEQQIRAGSPLKGIMFWRWDAVAASVNYAVGDNALTLPSSSDEFQTVIKPFSQRVAVLGATVASCSPSAGTVSAASIANTGPGPDAFAAPDSATCCASDCGTLYGSLNGTVIKSGQAASAGDCCNSCKTTTGCNTWNYCYCDLGCAGGVGRGTCVLKSQGNAFYPRALTTGDGAGWIGGVPGQTAITPSWLCQPGAGASCPIDQVATCPAAALQASLQCPSASCHAQDQNVAGDTIVFDVNSNSPTKVVYSAADCCKQCQQTSGCNTWTFCGHTEGCSSDCPANVAIAKQTGAKTFGPYGQCQGNRFPYQQCTLKNSAGNKLTVYEQGELQPWTSGTTF